MNEKETLVYFYYEHLQAVRRARKHYLILLLALLALVWVFYWGRPAASSANLFGMPLSEESLLGITPLLSTILLLGLVGSLRAAQPALELLREAWKNAGGSADLQLEMIDNHQNWIDHLSSIWVSPFGQVIYAVALLAVVVSTSAVGLALSPRFKGYTMFLLAAYCLLCLGIQAAAIWKWMAERVAALRHKD